MACFHLLADALEEGALPDEQVAFASASALHTVCDAETAAFENGEVREDEFVGDSGDVLLRGWGVGGVGNGGVLEVADDVDEGIGALEGVEGGPLEVAETLVGGWGWWEVPESDLGWGDLLRVEETGEGVEAGVRDFADAFDDAILGVGTGLSAAGEEVEEGGLAAAAQADEGDFHGGFRILGGGEICQRGHRVAGHCMTASFGVGRGRGGLVLRRVLSGGGRRGGVVREGDFG